MSRMLFFLTPQQRHNARLGVAHDPFQSGVRPKAGEAVEVLEGLLGFHRPLPYPLQPESVKFSKNLYRLKTAKNDPH